MTAEVSQKHEGKLVDIHSWHWFMWCYTSRLFSYKSWSGNLLKCFNLKQISTRIRQNLEVVAFVLHHGPQDTKHPCPLGWKGTAVLWFLQIIYPQCYTSGPSMLISNDIDPLPFFEYHGAIGERVNCPDHPCVGTSPWLKKMYYKILQDLSCFTPQSSEWPLWAGI